FDLRGGDYVESHLESRRWLKVVGYTLLVLGCIALAWAASEVLCGCTDKHVTIAAPQPPLLSELAGDYIADWSPATGASPRSETATTVSDVLALDHYPCFSLDGQESIGGTFDYDLAGHLHAELKTLSGATKVTTDGAFSGDGSYSGSYEVRV